MTGFGSGDGFGFGYGAGDGDGSGYGDGYGFGYDCDYGPDALCGTVYDFAVRLTPWGVRVGCELHSLAHWREHWREIAEKYNAPVTDAEADKLIAIVTKARRD